MPGVGTASQLSQTGAARSLGVSAVVSTPRQIEGQGCEAQAWRLPIYEGEGVPAPPHLRAIHALRCILLSLGGTSWPTPHFISSCHIPRQPPLLPSPLNLCSHCYAPPNAVCLGAPTRQSSPEASGASAATSFLTAPICLLLPYRSRSAP